MAASIACPYCYHTFTLREIMFRCTGELSPSGRRCSRKPDPVLSQRRGLRGDVGPEFKDDGRKLLAEHADCGAVTTFRICPHCHSTLPAQFGLVGHRLIAMVGAKASGKTVYMTVLLHELKNRIGRQLGSALMGADDATMARFDKSYHDPLYQDGQLFPGTPRSAINAELSLVDPLVYRFGLAERRGLRDRVGLSGPPQHTVLSFFDTAGEDFNSQESVQVNTRYLANADGIILVLDPLQMPGARALARPGTALPGDVGVDLPVNVLSRVTTMLLPHQSHTGLAARLGRGSDRISTPIAVVFAKLDAFWDTFSPASPLRAEPPGGDRFDVEDSLNVHEEVRLLLQQWQGTPIDGILAANYQRYRYFGVSALGNAPTADARIAATGIQPYRVADPLLWLLSEFGAVPKRGRG